MTGLNPQQHEAIHYLDGPCLVLAGAGSGKTRVITQKIAYLVNDCGFQPRNIAAITFTNKAAREMQERVAKLLPRAPIGQFQISTFHSLGVRILREEAKALGYKPRFSIFDSTDCAGIIGDLAGTVDKITLRTVQSIISNWKNALVSPERAAQIVRSEHETLAAKVYVSYEATLKAYQAVDFDDLIRMPVELFARNEEVRDKWQNRLRYLLVDEYQDTNACQYELLKLLTGVRAQFTAVGDDDQAIYAWRGADIENLKKLPAEFPSLKVIKLEQNYRSSVRILKAANNVISHNQKVFDKKLWSDLGLGEQISVTACRNNETEAEHVVMKLQAHRYENRTQWRDYAILYRSNHQARLMEQYLRDQKVPYLLSGGQSFFDKTEIKDITSYLRLLVNEDDDPAFIRAATTPKRGIGAQTLEALGTYAGERHISLFAALFEEGFAHRVQTRQLEPLAGVRQFHQPPPGTGPAGNARAGAAGFPQGHRLRAVPLRPRGKPGGRKPLGQRARFHPMAGSQGGSRRQESDRADPEHRPHQHARQAAGGRGRGADVHPARLQGSGIQPRLPGRRRGRHPAPPGIRGDRQGGGRTAPDVRRHHPGPANPAHLLLRAPQAGPGDALLRPFPLHRRDGLRGRPLLRRQDPERA